MANTYADTVLLEARLWQDENMSQKFERRKQNTNILPVFLAGQEYIPDIEDIKMATTQATALMYLKKQDFTINSVKSCSPSGETGGSGKQALTWAQKGVAVKHQTKKYAGNELTSIRGLAYDLAEAEKSFWFGASGIDSILLAYLEANRTQVNALSSLPNAVNTWAGTPDFEVQTANANLDRFYNYLLSDMQANNYTGMYHDIHDTLWQSEVAHYGQQGTANAVNTAYQFDDVMRYSSNLIQPTGYNQSVHYIIPEGGVAFLTWNEMLNREGAQDGDRTWGTWESRYFPGLFFDYFAKSGCADTTADGGATQDRVIDYELTLNYAIVKQPLTTANESPIFKYAVKTS